jgi:hypothetical protein
MNTPDRSIPEHDALSIAELEARFEMQVIHVPTNPVEDFRSSCTVEY